MQCMKEKYMEYRNNRTGGGYPSQIKRLCVISFVFTIAALFVACDDSSSSTSNPSTPSSPISYTVIFKDRDTELDSQTVNEGETATRLAEDPTRNDYAFIGWGKAESSKAFDFTETITEDTTFNAIWVSVPDSLTYDYVDGYTNQLVVSLSSASSDSTLYIPAKTAGNANATVTEIKASGFAGLAKTTVYLPQGIKNIGRGAFSGCASLKTIHYGGTKEDFNSASGYGSALGIQGVTIKCRDGEMKIGE